MMLLMCTEPNLKRMHEDQIASSETKGLHLGRKEKLKDLEGDINKGDRRLEQLKGGK